MDYTTIAASIEHARADIRVQIDGLRERDTALEQSLEWLRIAFGIDDNGEPISVEGDELTVSLGGGHEMPVQTMRDPHAKPTRQQAMAEAAKEMVTCEGCGREMSKFGIGRHRAKCTPVAAEKPATPAPLPAGAVVDLDMARALL